MAKFNISLSFLHFFFIYHGKIVFSVRGAKCSLQIWQSYIKYNALSRLWAFQTIGLNKWYYFKSIWQESRHFSELLVIGVFCRLSAEEQIRSHLFDRPFFTSRMYIFYLTAKAVWLSPFSTDYRATLNQKSEIIC